MEIHHLDDRRKRKRRGVSLQVLFLFAAASAFAAAPDGYVVRVDSATAYLDWGKASGVQVNQEFDVYRTGAELKHPVTGEVLGHAEERVGQGVIQSVDDKFSVASILEHRLEWKAGDRTRLKAAPIPESAAVAPADVPTAASAAPPSTLPTGPVPKLLWTSEPFAGEPRGIATGDLSGDGMQDVVVALKDRIEVYRWETDHLTLAATYKDRRTTNWVAVDTADLDHSGHAKIFATWYMDGVYGARVAVLDLSSGTLKEIGHLDGFARAFPRKDGSAPLLVQDFSLSRELRMREPELLVFDGKKYKTSKTSPLPRFLNNQLFGYAWGDFDGDKTEDWAVLENGDRLNVVFKEKKWRGENLYGGTKLDFAFSNTFDSAVTLFPRLTPWKNAAGQELLLVPHNDLATGLHFTHLKLFHGGELLALAWNGSDMLPVWRVPASNYLADYCVGAEADPKHADLWLLTEAPGDKAVLSGYTLP